MPLSSTTVVLSRPIDCGSRNRCYGQTRLHVDEVDMISGGSHRGVNESKETETRPDPTATGGDGAHGHTIHLFALLSGTTTIPEILMASFEYPS